MLKTLSFATVFALCTFQFDLVSAQTSSRPTEPRVSANHLENPLPASGEDAPRAVSPAAIAEARKLYKEGVKYGRAGLFTQAAELFQRAVKLNPDYADAHQRLGHTYFDMRRWEEAIQSLQHALALKPKDKKTRRRIDEAQRMMQVETDPRDAKSQEKSIADRPIPPQPVDVQVSPNRPPLSSSVLTTDASVNETTLTRIYLVGSGDVLDVRLDLRPDAGAGEPASPGSTLFTISPSGLLEHPSLTAPLPVGGLTVEEISARLEDDLKRRGLADKPKVSVGVQDYVSHAILVSGLAKEPGTKILKREAIPLYVVVADAQPLPEAAKVTLVRNKSNQVYEIGLTQTAEMSLLVHPGDVITLQPNPAQFFYMGGEVKAPGEKTFRRGLTLTQAIIAAGGLSRKSGEARVARDDGKGFLSVSRYKLKDIDSGKQPDPLIQPGDRITIVE
jgi:protein involved in polysaccharide export with SLBB domain